MENLISQLQTFGLDVSSPVLDNTIHRVPFRGSRDVRGWYTGAVLNNKIYCTYGSWDAPESHKYTDNGIDTTEANRTWAMLAEVHRQHKAEAQRKAAKKAVRILAAAPDCPADHPYLIKKGIKPVKGLKLEEKTGAILVPMYDADYEITSLQRIFPDGEKKMLYDGRKKKSCFVINGDPALPPCICEGLATGISINEATGRKVLVAFDVGNLENVARIAAETYPDLIICADNDHTKDPNAGLTRGKVIAGNIPGARLCFTEGIAGSDFNDLHQEKGAEAVRKAIMGATGKQSIPKPLSRDSIAPVDKWISLTPPPIDWVLDNLIPVGAVGAMPGMGGTGKSNLSLLIARVVATGRHIEPFHPTKPRSVLLLNVEDSSDDQWRRLHAQITRTPPQGENELRLLRDNLMIYQGRGEVGPLMGLDGANPRESAWGKWFAESVHNLKPEFIILDTKSRLYGLDENSNDHASQWLAYIERIANNSNAAVLILHHTAKARSGESDQLSSRGASAFIDNARFCFSLTNLSESEAKRYAVEDSKCYFKMEMVKGNYSAPRKAWFFRKGEAGYPELVNLEEDRFFAASALLHEKLSELQEPITWRELRDREEGKTIRKVLRDEHNILRDGLSKLWDMLIDSKRAKLVEVLTEKTGQIRTVIMPQTVEAAKEQIGATY